MVAKKKNLVVLAMSCLPDRIYGDALAALKIYGLLTRQHLTQICSQIQDHTEMLPTFITKLGHFSLVLGIPWIRRHAIVTDFVSNSV